MQPRHDVSCNEIRSHVCQPQCEGCDDKGQQCDVGYEEIKRLRVDNDKLRRNAQRLLGQQLDQVNVADLVARVDALVDEKRRLAAELHQTTEERTALRSRVTELEEDLAAARTALRQMIREQTADLGTHKP